jgi:hypothetical protein
MNYTGRRYGLVINRRIDERRNIFASTQAAISYLSELYDTFGSWALAAAAYNMGEERLNAEIVEQGVNNYYQLYLPLETQRYVFRIILRIQQNMGSISLKKTTIPQLVSIGSGSNVSRRPQSELLPRQRKPTSK